jgi:hypothetical protein
VEFFPGMQGWFNICKSIHKMYHINRIKDKNHIVISLNAGKTVDKMQHSFMMKTLFEMGVEAMYLNIIKVIWDKPTADSCSKNLKDFALR